MSKYLNGQFLGINIGLGGVTFCVTNIGWEEAHDENESMHRRWYSCFCFTKNVCKCLIVICKSSKLVIIPQCNLPFQPVDGHGRTNDDSKTEGQKILNMPAALAKDRNTYSQLQCSHYSSTLQCSRSVWICYLLSSKKVCWSSNFRWWQDTHGSRLALHSSSKFPL